MTTGNYTVLSWQDTSATGNPAANRACGDCHDLTSEHFNHASKRLIPGYENDIYNSNCNQCHTLGLGDDDPDWYTTYTAFQSSAHGSRKCSECHDVHGASGPHPGMVKISGSEDQQDLCYKCHSETGGVMNNAISGPGLADDIEQAFSFGGANKHSLGASYDIGGSSYTLECVSCHNVHLVTGKYWEADQDVTPVTRISTPSNQTGNLEIWGDESGEKMDDYASGGSGTYRTPNGDLFAGDELPSYTDFCNECHNPMPRPDQQIGAHGGLGFDSDHHGLGSANVPDNGDLCPNWENCGKGVSWDADNCTADDEGGSDTACWPVIPRGRGEQIWSKSPYNQEERISGENFVLSCTDCHEAHGSSVRSLIRTRLNDVDDSGTTTWNSSCLACHYYNSDFHRGFTCGNASCHGANADYGRMSPEGEGGTSTDTLHRMGQRSGDPGIRTFDPDLVLDMRFEGNLKDSGSYRLDGGWVRKRAGIGSNNHLTAIVDPPGSGFEYTCANDAAGIGSFVMGQVGNAIEVNNQPVEVGTEDCEPSTWTGFFEDYNDSGQGGHDHGGHGTWKYTEMKYNMTLEAWVNPTDDTNERKIMSKHSYYWGGGYALVIEQIDGSLRAELMTNVNGGSGSNDCNGLRGAYSTVSIPLNEWTHVAATYDSTGPDRNDNAGSVGRIRIYVDGEDVTTSSSDVSSCYAQPGTGEDAMFPNSDHNILDPGGWYDSAFAIGGVNWHPLYGGTGPDANQSFIGMIDEVKVLNITKPAGYFDEMVGPAITKVESVSGLNEVYVEFSEGVYGHDLLGDPVALVADDFSYDNANPLGATSISGVVHTAGESTAVVTLNSPLSIDDIGIDTLAANSDSIYDEYDNDASTDIWPITEISGVPMITVVQGVVSHNKVAVWFSERVYANTDATGILQPDDFDSSGLPGAITAVDHNPGEIWATLTLVNPIADIGSTTLAAAGGSIYDITGIPAPINTITMTAGLLSSISSVEGVAGIDRLEVTFQSQVYANDDETGALEPGDFNLTASVNIDTVLHSAGDPVAIITLDGPLAAGDINTTSTLAAVSDSIFGPGAGNFSLGTDPVTITGQTAPSITRVEGAEGFDQVYVSFTEGVYTGMGQSGALQTTDFADSDSSWSISGVTHVAGQSTAVLTLDSVLDSGDIGVETIAAVSSEIFNSADNPAGTTAVTIIGNDCPAWGTSVPIEDIPQYALWGGVPADGTILDETGLLTGTVGNPTFAFPDVDNDWFNGDEGQGTYINLSNTACFNSPRALTIEARVKPTEVDRGVADNTFNRIFERRRTFLVTILNTDYRGDDIPTKYDKASIEVKYRVENVYAPGSRHTCPHPQWPADPYTGNDARMHQMSSDIDQYPIYNNHWYLIRVVFNSDKSNVSGSNGTPVDIYIDDQGTDAHLYEANPDPGNPTLNPDYEQWAGYKNATKRIRGSSSCRWGALPGDVINDTSDSSHIGSNWNHAAQLFEGQIDWVTWQPVADYTGVTDGPK
jgi:predicted CXXCH cytochrome family protein